MTPPQWASVAWLLARRPRWRKLRDDPVAERKLTGALIVGALIVGVLFTLANSMMIPKPLWVTIASFVILFPPLVGGLLTARRGVAAIGSDTAIK